MATCKDCLHDEVCPVPHLKDASVCPHFKDRTKWVEQKCGKWKYGTRSAVCSECGFERHLDDDFGRAIACPNCNARMDL